MLTKGSETMLTKFFRSLEFSHFFEQGDFDKKEAFRQ